MTNHWTLGVPHLAMDLTPIKTITFGGMNIHLDPFSSYFDMTPTGPAA